MSYTPDNQLLHDPLTKLLEGIDETCAAINERVKSPGEWDLGHLDAIADMRRRLQDLQLELVRLRERTR